MSQPAEPSRLTEERPAQQPPAVALHPPQSQAQEARESQVPRKQGVTDGAWDAQDAEAMREAQSDKQSSAAAGDFCSARK